MIDPNLLSVLQEARSISPQNSSVNNGASQTRLQAREPVLGSQNGKTFRSAQVEVDMSGAAPPVSDNRLQNVV